MTSLSLQTLHMQAALPAHRFELVVSASDSAADVAQRVEAQAGLPRGESRLLLNGVELDGSLASYGVRPGAVLELVPHELGVPAALPPGSPLLSSPQHELARALAGVGEGGCAGTHMLCHVKHVHAVILLGLCGLSGSLLAWSAGIFVTVANSC